MKPKQPASKWERIDDMVYADKVKTGQVLVFEFEGTRTCLKIMRKSGDKVWAKHIDLVKPEDVEVVDAED
jgi:hypothetical protein